MLQFLLNVLVLFPFLVFPFFWGLDDGLMKRKGTEAHWPKWVMFACLGWFIFYDFEPLMLLGWAVLWKPVFDIGWAKGSGQAKYYIGSTSWTDRLVNWLIPREVIPAVYSVLTFVGYFMMYHFNFIFGSL